MFSAHTTKGITLVECIVAVSILAIAISGPMTLASQSLHASRDARDELVATHLAEEAIEVVHSVRDNNSADDTSNSYLQWMNNIMGSCDVGEGCVIDVTAHKDFPLPAWNINPDPRPLLQCPAGNCSSVSQVYYNPSTGLYRQSLASLTSPWQKTPYSRSLQVVPVDDPTTPKRQVRLISTVTYVGYGGKTRTVSVTDDLYNWFPPLR